MWAIQQQLGAQIVRANPGVNLQLSISIRVAKSSGAAGVAFNYGIYDAAAESGVWSGAVNASDIADGDYHTYTVPAVALTHAMYDWIAPVDGSGCEINVDRMWLKK